MHIGSIAAALLSGLVVAACATDRASVPSALEGLGDRPAVAAQGWGPKQRYAWYKASQGSRLLPYRWLKALEADDGTPLMTIDRMEAWGYLRLDADLAAAHPESDPALPIGFAVDIQNDDRLVRGKLRWFAGQGNSEPWVGMNCAACHTGEIASGDQRLRIDGGPGLGDFQGFVEAVDASLAATLADEARFGRFAVAVLAPRPKSRASDTPANRAALRAALATLSGWQANIARANATGTMRYGPARLDAFGRIFNKVTLLAAGDTAEGNPATAPVSYPFLWNTPQHDRVQWNGLASNTRLLRNFDYGALGRNAGEVVGVFGEAVLTPGGGHGFRSSVAVRNLGPMEKMLEYLRPPAWPVGLFAAIDPVKAAAGKTLFAANCVSCHAILAPDDLKTPIRANFATFRQTISRGQTPTDPWMACNAYFYQSATGVLEGTPATVFKGPKFGPSAPVGAMLSTTVVGLLAGQPGAVVRTGVDAFLHAGKLPDVVTATEGAPTRADTLARCFAEIETGDKPILGYKARPLNGIWATAPYLHNGSVPSLHELLLPPTERSRAFPVGTHAYDPVAVGYSVAPSAAGRFTLVTRDAAGEPIPGNGNEGHDYGNASFSPADRAALVEYLKTL